jgi:hypothetical protein
MANIAELLADLAKRSGVPEDHEGLKPLLSITATIPDDVYEQINSAFMTIEGAKQNLEVKNYFTAQFADRIDKKIPQFLQAFGIDENDVAEVEAIKSTGKKLDAAFAKLAAAKKALEEVKTGDTEAEKKAAQRLQMAEAALQEAKQNAEKLVQEERANTERVSQELQNYRRGNAMERLLSDYQWSDQYPSSVRDTLFKSLWGAELSKLGAVEALEDNKLVLKQAQDPSLLFTVNNKAFDPAELVKKIMTENKLIAVAPKPTGTSTTSGTAFQAPQRGNGGDNGAKRVPNAFQAALSQSLAEQGAQ